MGLPDFRSPAAALEYAQGIMQLFAKAQPLYRGLDEKERGPADELPAIAAAALIRFWEHEKPCEPALLLQVRNSNSAY